MSLVLDGYESLIPDAIRHFWGSRSKASEKQKSRGTADQGARSAVTAGKNLDGFVDAVRQLVVDNGLKEGNVIFKGNAPTLPGFFRATKEWDLIVFHEEKLIAAVEFKSQVGPSFGNNVNNRAEEAIGNAVDLLTAHREGAFSASTKPFLGYLFVLEECEKSTRPTKAKSPLFETFPEFQGASYAQRYEILCRKLIQEQLYDAAALLMTKTEAIKSGEHRSLSEITSHLEFGKQLAGRIAAASA